MKSTTLLSSAGRKYTALGALSVILWGVTLPILKRAQEISGIWWMCVFFFAGSIPLIGVRLIFDRTVFITHLRQAERKKVLIRGALFVFYFMALFGSIAAVPRAQTPAVIFMNYLWPSFTIVAGLFCFPQPYNKLVLFLGTVIVCSALLIELVVHPLLLSGSNFSSPPLPVLLIVCAGACAWGFYFVLGRLWGVTAGASAIVPVNMFVGLIVSLLCALLLTPAGSHPWQAMPRDELWIILFFLIQQPLGMILWDVSTRRGDIVTLSLLADFAPWIALATSVWFLNVSLSLLSLCAAVLLVTGAVISRVAFIPAVAGKSLD